MGPLFEERERGYEAKWVHDRETQFKIMARRNALLGQWAAELLQMPSSKASHYASSIVELGVIGKGSDPVFEKVRDDLRGAGVTCSDADIHKKMRQLFDQAVNDVKR